MAKRTKNFVLFTVLSVDGSAKRKRFYRCLLYLSIITSLFKFILFSFHFPFPFPSFLHSLLCCTHHLQHIVKNHPGFSPDSTRKKNRGVHLSHTPCHFTVSDPCSTISLVLRFLFACYYGNDIV